MRIHPTNRTPLLPHMPLASLHPHFATARLCALRLITPSLLIFITYYYYIHRYNTSCTSVSRSCGGSGPL